jgi:hypothetical protein
MWPEDQRIIEDGYILHESVLRHEKEKMMFKEIIKFYTGWRK